MCIELGRRNNKKREIWSLFVWFFRWPFYSAFVRSFIRLCFGSVRVGKMKFLSVLLYFSTFVLHFGVKRNVERSSEHGKSLDIWCVNEATREKERGIETE